MPYSLSLTGCQVSLSPSTITISADPSTLSQTGTSQITARFTDGAGAGIDGQTVNFSINSGPGTLSAASAVTGGGGYASVDLTGNGTIATTSVRASLASPSCGCADTTVNFVAPPNVTAVNPASGLQGQCPKTIAITGTNFLGATAVSFGTGIIVNSFMVNSSTQITANICIDTDATVGARNVSVTTLVGTGTLRNSFTVNTSPLNRQIGAGAPTSHGSFAGSQGTYGYSPPVALPTIVVQSASLSAKAVTPGAPVAVTADITNKSAVNGNKKVTLYVNGQVETTQGVTVNSGGSSQLTFNLSRSEPGDYNVYVDGVPAGSFKVELFRESDAILIISAALVALAFILGMVMLGRRQRAGIN
jgi:hypothetical protein